MLLALSVAAGLVIPSLLDSGAGAAAAVAAVVCLGAAALGARTVGSGLLPPCPLAVAPGGGGRLVLAALPALCLAILTGWVVWRGGASPDLEMFLWVVSFAALAGGVGFGSHRASARPEATGDPEGGDDSEPQLQGRRRAGLLHTVLVAVVLLAAAAVRLVDLERYPLVVHNDEASCGLMAHEIVEEWRGHGVNWFAPRSFYWFPTLGFVPSAIGQAVAPPNLHGHRLANGLLSIAALACLYLLLKDTVGAAPALVGLWLGSVGHFSVHFARSGIHSGHAGFLAILCAWLLWRGFRTGGTGWFMAAGLGLAACGLTYHGALVVPLWLGSVAGACWLASASFRRRWSALLLLAAAATLVAVAPMVGTWLSAPDTFIARRGSMVFSTEEESVRHMRSIHGDEYLPAVLATNLGRALKLFSTIGDSNSQYGWRGGGLLDRTSSALFLTGLGLGLGVVGRRQVWPILVGVAGVWLLGAVLTMDAVQYSRVAGLMLLVGVPQAWFAAALLTAAEHGFGRAGRRIAAAALVVGLAVVGAVNLHLYFVRHDRDADRLEVIRTVIARDARDDGPRTATVVSCRDLPCDLEHRTHQFLAADRQVSTIGDPDEVASMEGGGTSRTVIVVAHTDSALKDAILERFPWATVEPRILPGYSSEPLFDRLVVPPYRP